MVLVVSTIFLIIQLIIVTISYLKYDSIMKIEIFDQNFDKIGLPPIEIHSNLINLLTAKDSNKILNSLVNQKRCISLEKLNELYFEFKELNVFNCEINNNGVLEDCDKFIGPVVHISGYPKDLKNLYHIFERIGECIKGSLIQILSQFNSVNLILKYFVHNQRNITYKRHFNGNYVKQKDFLQIYPNSTMNSKLEFAFSIDDYNSHDDDGVRRRYLLIDLKGDKKLSLFKKSFELLKFPYKSKCSYYDRSETPFNSSSYRHCIRQCFRYLCQSKLNCSCFVLNGEVHQTDYGYKSLNICHNYYYFAILEHNYTKLCTNFCLFYATLVRLKLTTLLFRR